LEECTCPRSEKKNAVVDFKQITPFITRITCKKCGGVLAWIENDATLAFKDKYDPSLLEKMK